MTRAPELTRAKYQRGSRCVHGDYTARELDKIIADRGELLAALKSLEWEVHRGELTGSLDTDAVERAAEQARAAIAKAEGR